MSRLVGWSTISAIALLLSASPVAAQNPEEQACRGGDTQACFTVGMHYLGNMDNAPNVERSMPFFTKACDGGVGKACFALGGIFQTAVSTGLSFPNDLPRAKELFQRACSAGFEPGCTRVTQLQDPAYSPTGRRPTPNEEAGCKRGDGDNCWTVALYIAGDGSDPTKMGQAAPALEKACVGSVGNACSMLGVMYQNGTGVTQDIARSLSYYTKGCDLGASLSCQQRDKLNGTATVAAASQPAPAPAPAPGPVPVPVPAPAAAASGQPGDATFEGVRIGMSQDDVRRKLGDPLGRAPSTDGGETWAFRGRTLGVTFDGHRSVSGVVAIAREAGGFEGIRIQDDLSTLKDLSSKRGWKVDDLGTMLLISGSGWTLLASGQAGKIAMLTWTAAGN